MTSQQDTSLEYILRKFLVDTIDLTKNNKPLDEAIQALTSWKDKEVELERQNRIKKNKSFCGCPMCSHHTKPYVESLQSQGGK